MTEVGRLVPRCPAVFLRVRQWRHIDRLLDIGLACPFSVPSADSEVVGVYSFRISTPSDSKPVSCSADIFPGSCDNVLKPCAIFVPGASLGSRLFSLKKTCRRACYGYTLPLCPCYWSFDQLKWLLVFRLSYPHIDFPSVPSECTRKKSVTKNLRMDSSVS